MPPNGIARISMPNDEDFFRSYVFERLPIVITGLFDGQEISAIRTIEEATRAWGPMELQVQEEYASAEGVAASTQPAVMSLREYVDFTRAERSTRRCCTEYETPARVLASFRLPSVCRITTPSDQEIFGLPKKYGDFDLVTNTFIANEGNVAHLHFDGDQREVLLHQVYGRKRITLFPPAAAIHLRTLDGPVTRPSLAGLSLEHMSLDEQQSIVALAGGYQTVLEPGETIYIPMLMWHHVEYLDDAMSFNLRFGRTRFGRFLSLDNFHRDPYIQNVASQFVGTDDAPRGFAPVIEDLEDAYLEPAPDLRHKVRQVRARFRELCGRLCPEAAADQLCPPEREEEQISRIVESKDMVGGLKYADPAIIARTRPVGEIAPRQQGIIEDRMRAYGYSKEVEQTVIHNRTGKTDIAALTKAEAAQLIDYFTTPGARW
jgi:lysine-specific demethylase 8